MAFGIGCPVLPVDSLLIVAEDARAQVAPDAAEFEVDVAYDGRMAKAAAEEKTFDLLYEAYFEPPK